LKDSITLKQKRSLYVQQHCTETETSFIWTISLQWNRNIADLEGSVKLKQNHRLFGR